MNQVMMTKIYPRIGDKQTVYPTHPKSLNP